jgi:hypothetical protein
MGFLSELIGYGVIVYICAASQRRLNLVFKACLLYIHSLRRLDHVTHLATSVMGTLLADYAKTQLLSFLYKVLHVRHICFRLVVSAHRSLAMSQFYVVLDCRAWNVLPHDMKILLTWASFVFVVRRMVRRVDALNWVVFLWHPPRCWM